MVHKKTIEAIKNCEPKLSVKFFKQESSEEEPVRSWLKSLPEDEKKEIGADIRAAQLGWPIGLPLVKHIDSDIWEVRTRLKDKIARVLFIIDDKKMVLLHGFIKKTNKLPTQDLRLAKNRLKIFRGVK
jgi:phage-related protein